MHHPGVAPRAPRAAPHRAPHRAPRAALRTALASAGWAAASGAGLLLSRHTVPDGGALALVSAGSGLAAVWFAAPRRPLARALDAALLAAVSVLVHLHTGATGLVAASASAAVVVQTLLFTALLRRWCPGAGPARPLLGVRALVRLLAAVGVAVLAGALIGPTAAWWDAGRATWLDLPVWVARNGLSVLLLSCAGLRLAAGSGRCAPRAARPAGAERPRWAEGTAVFALTAAAYAAQFAPVGGLSLVFLLPVLTVWAALRCCSRTVVWHCLLTGTAAVVPTLLGHGPFAGVADPALRALVVQAFACVTAVIGLVLALGRDERDALLADVRARAEESRRQAESAELLSGALRSLNAAEDAREVLCEVTARTTGADAVHLVEPDGRGALVTRAVWGEGATALSVPAGEGGALTEAFRSGEPRFEVGPPALPGAASAAHQPITTAGGRTAGLLVMCWREPLAELPAPARALVSVLALEAAHGIERADLLTQLALAAERDPLTGLANRRRWDETTAQEIARAVRSGLPLSFCLVDLDHFKRYNDTQGHLAGDALLQEFATAASGCLREVDTLARWGGEEFVLALPGCSAAGARAVADRIRAVVPRGQTCTIGVAQWQPGLSAAEVIALADLALYEGKAAGRDTTVVSDVALPGAVAR
ncbi:diguanylate cyclase domain-containing protein [Kineococcus gypseus]|uniref:GGDEF domain-containing protein n=1 Tax=Kineococcus gypseus TaxID=1637102 RepID=UPI003D7D6733